MAINQATILGRSGADPELRYTPNGTAVVSLSLATSEKRGDAEETYWHRVTIYGKSAEIAAKQIRKGSEVFIQGKMHPRSWKDKETNQWKNSHEVVAFVCRVVQGRAEAEQRQLGGGYDQQTSSYAPAGSSKPLPDTMTEDDIPF